MSKLDTEILKEHIKDFMLMRIEFLEENLKNNKTDDACRYNQLKDNLEEICKRVQDEELRSELYNIFSELLSENILLTYQQGLKDGIQIKNLM